MPSKQLGLIGPNSPFQPGPFNLPILTFPCPVQPGPCDLSSMASPAQTCIGRSNLCSPAQPDLTSTGLARHLRTSIRLDLPGTCAHW